MIEVHYEIPERGLEGWGMIDGNTLTVDSAPNGPSLGEIEGILRELTPPKALAIMIAGGSYKGLTIEKVEE
jgi:hypothetical protein